MDNTKLHTLSIYIGKEENGGIWEAERDLS